MFISPSTAHRFSAAIAAQATAAAPVVRTGYEALQAQEEFAPYFSSTDIRESDEATLREYFFRHPNVDQDMCMVVTIKRGDPHTQALTTDGLGPCIAICARGKNPQGDTVLYLAHESTHIGTIGIARALIALCLQNHCDPADVSIYIVGGAAPEVDANGDVLMQQQSDMDEGNEGDEGDEGDSTEDPLHYRETLEALIDYPQVKAVRLPIMPFSRDYTEPATAVVLTETEVLYCRSNAMPQDGAAKWNNGNGLHVDAAKFDAITKLNHDAVQQAKLAKMLRYLHSSAAEPPRIAQGGALSKDADGKQE
ncbi:MAG: hypothetical protein K0Q43_3007 [Ramlibacter sp.]|jgi:hypothetical protein|nr:hypothetical protein [Ramlibacter sp.]